MPTGRFVNCEDNVLDQCFQFLRANCEDNFLVQSFQSFQYPKVKIKHIVIINKNCLLFMPYLGKQTLRISSKLDHKLNNEGYYEPIKKTEPN